MPIYEGAAASLKDWLLTLVVVFTELYLLFGQFAVSSQTLACQVTWVTK